MSLKRLVVSGCVALDDAGLALPRWLRQARPLAARLAVSGGLLFDGERWLQLIEGEPTAVGQLLAGLRQANPAMGEPQLLLDSDVQATQRLSPGWFTGYLEPEELERIHERLAVEGALALPAFVRVLLGSDPG